MPITLEWSATTENATVLYGGDCGTLLSLIGPAPYTFHLEMAQLLRLPVQLLVYPYCVNARFPSPPPASPFMLLPTSTSPSGPPLDSGPSEDSLRLTTEGSSSGLYLLFLVVWIVPACGGCAYLVMRRKLHFFSRKNIILTSSARYRTSMRVQSDLGSQVTCPREHTFAIQKYARMGFEHSFGFQKYARVSFEQQFENPQRCSIPIRACSWI